MTLFRFQLITLADYGFMTCIGKARLIARNITLFLGSAHCKNLACELQNIGYEIIYLQEHDKNKPLSQKECENLFTVQPNNKVMIRSNL